MSCSVMYSTYRERPENNRESIPCHLGNATSSGYTVLTSHVTKVEPTKSMNDGYQRTLNLNRVAEAKRLISKHKIMNMSISVRNMKSAPACVCRQEHSSYTDHALRYRTRTS
jgi:hypothetical protein